MSTRDRLSTHAARLFAERGYHGTSVSDLAAALGIHKSSVYAHIATKEDLLAEITLAGAAAFHTALDGVPVGGSPSERLHLALRAHLDVVASQIEVATVWLQEWRYLTGEARERFLAERHRYEKRISDLMGAAVESGELRANLDVRRATLLFLSAGNWSYTWFTRDTDVAQVTDAFWDLLIHGMGAPAPSA